MEATSVVAAVETELLLLCFGETWGSGHQVPGEAGMAVVAAKENTFMPGGPGAGRTNTTFGRRKPTIICEEVRGFLLTLKYYKYKFI